MTKFSGVLFDKDGTLFDFHATWGAWAFAFLRDLAGGDQARARDLGAAVGFDIRTRVFEPGSPVVAGTPGEIAEHLLPLLPGANPSALISRMNVTAATAPQAEAAPLAPLLGELRKRGLRLGVATNDGEVPARAHLHAAGVADLFDMVIGSDSGFGAKPDAGPLLAFCREMGLAPSSVLMVGDSRHDILAGRAAGMTTVAVLTGPTERSALQPLADAVLPDVSHLPRWIDTLPVAVSAA